MKKTIVYKDKELELKVNENLGEFGKEADLADKLFALHLEATMQFANHLQDPADYLRKTVDDKVAYLKALLEENIV